MSPLSFLLPPQLSLRVDFTLSSGADIAREELMGYELLRGGNAPLATGYFSNAIKHRPERALRIADACLRSGQNFPAERALYHGFIWSYESPITTTKEVHKLEILSCLLFHQATNRFVHSQTDLSHQDILSISEYTNHPVMSPKRPGLVIYRHACTEIVKALTQDIDSALISISCLVNLKNYFREELADRFINKYVLPYLKKLLEQGGNINKKHNFQIRDIIYAITGQTFYVDFLEKTNLRDTSAKVISSHILTVPQKLKRRNFHLSSVSRS